ncbi:MAG: nucleotidyltransferase domain-containing protein [Candidatus Nanohaloarchaea archaeon]|nr:nucleotidyltransferase domain-containing protein [Candidatus Nanohaloarchaea archaeon]
MITAERIKLLKAWQDNPFEELTTAEVMDRRGKNSKPWTYNALEKLVEKDLLEARKKGNMKLYSLKMENPFLVQALQYVESQESLDFPHIELFMDVVDKVPVKGYSLLVFGSYAVGEQKDGSDLDLCFLVRDEEDEKKIKPYFDEAVLDHAVGVDEHYITFEEFKQMLVRDEENLGKQIFRKNIKLYNPEIYYRLLKEAYNNGFQP